MKKEKYTICFQGGTIAVTANGFTQAVILGMAAAIKKGWDYRPMHVRDDSGRVVDQIKFPEFNKTNFR